MVSDGASMNLHITSSIAATHPEVLTVKTAADISYHAARTRQDREMCFRLVHDVYVRLGYMKPNPGGIRFNAHLASPGTTTFAAVKEDLVMGTMTLFMDGMMGLPCEAVFAEEVTALRRQGRKVAEVGALASVDCGQRGGLERFLTLARMCGRYAFEQGVDDALITVNPRHRDIYPKLLKFEPVSARRTYAGVENHPAICYRIRRELFPTAHWVQGATIPPVPAQGPVFSVEERGYFQGLAAGVTFVGAA